MMRVFSFRKKPIPGFRFSILRFLLLSIYINQPVFSYADLVSVKTFRSYKEQDILQQITKPAEFPGGYQALNAYMENNFVFPAVAFKMKGYKGVAISTQLIIQIDINGSARFLKQNNLIIQPNRAAVITEFESGFVKLIEQMPTWQPALQGGSTIISSDTIFFRKEFAPGFTWEDYQKSKQKQIAMVVQETPPAEKLKTKDGKLVYMFVEKPAVFSGGHPALLEFVFKNLPEVKAIGGTPVVLDIIINENGIAEDIRVLKPEGIKLNSEAVKKALKQMPFWVPAKQYGKAIAFRHILPLKPLK